MSQAGHAGAILARDEKMDVGLAAAAGSGAGAGSAAAVLMYARIRSRPGTRPWPQRPSACCSDRLSACVMLLPGAAIPGRI